MICFGNKLNDKLPLKIWCATAKRSEEETRNDCVHKPEIHISVSEEKKKKK